MGPLHENIFKIQSSFSETFWQRLRLCLQEVKPRSLASEEMKANKAVLHSAMSNFFSPAAVVRPRRAGRRVASWRRIEAGGGRAGGGGGGGGGGREGVSRGGRRQEEEEGEKLTTSWEEARALAKTCYTHTVLLAGQCWVLCDHILVAPCRQQNYKK